ncbi:MAG: RagB/SusD family nutrient uptake outer membrane protein [Alistipes sp.]|nr:RagB/SusD family nutrient uptake outer membrane protein [Alistipes sp.]MDE6861889.1 RagB/SusD family nutrient uptake outer membrane protein [Alistipes sp.]
MKRYKVLLMTFAAACTLGASSCVGDLDVTPIDPNIQLPAEVLDSQEAYEQLLAKCYQGLACSSSYGPNGDPDISGVDGGFGQYMRALWNMQCLTTDEATCSWNDTGLPDMHNMCWTTSNQFIVAMYYRIFYQVGLCNEFIRQVNANVAGLSDADFPKKAEFVAEARALRAFSYYHAIDLFGNVPFSTEANSVGSNGPAQISRVDLFNWLVEECKALLADDSGLIAPGQNIYGRCDKGFVQMILAKLYLNAEVWAGEQKYAECAALCRQIMSEYSLHNNYAELFMADNHLWTKNQTYNGDEIIFTVPQDGIETQSYGATNFLVFAAVGGSMDATSFGISSGWGGLSLTKDFTSKFDLDNDARAMFYTAYGPSIDDYLTFDASEGESGYKSMKYTNINHDGSAGKANGFVDTDVPVFRAADAYLMLAECAKSGGATETEGLAALNDVRMRSGLAKVDAYSKQDVLDERARELYWEFTRRQDLIRFGQFTTNDYLWEWKGGVKNGTAVDSRMNLMPLPPADINANGNLSQNEGY